MNESRFEFIAGLLVKWLRNDLTEKEKQAWERWLAESPDNRAFAERLQDPDLVMKELRLFYETKDRILLKIRQQIPELNLTVSPIRPLYSKRSGFRPGPLLKYAAAVLLLAVIGVLFWTHQKTTDPVAQTVPVQNIIQPGTNKVILTLGNGSKIILDSTQHGIVASDKGASILVKDNQLSYQPDNASGEISYNTMTTPRGGQYKLLLPDGSAVWLNAQSSITYPVRFTGNERKVSITGEVYFEVVKDPVHPFIVDIHNKTFIEVLGTHFNVNTYEDENTIHTTLLEGSVLIRNERDRQLLKPNQQARSGSNGTIRLVSLDANDINEVMAWKNGAFYFNEADIYTVMRQLARWYDFDINYEGPVKEKFHLEMQRNTSIENVFRILEETRGVHFKIEGKKVTVRP